ncbi:hypothetical protein QZH41_001395 [Actinostola sp. cb2023]|nr:hypothetical protein QZH41_001395 [Actinostola sp. cb2023]
MASTDSTWKDELRKAIKEEMRSFLDRDKSGPSGSNVQGPSSSKKSDKTLNFEEFYVKREEARRGDFKPKKKKIKLSSDKKESIPKQVEVKVALAYQDDVSSDDDEDLKPAFSSESKASLSSQPKDSSSLKGKGKSPMHSQVTNVPSSSVSSSYSSYMEVIHDWDDDMDPDMDPDYLAAIEASLLDQTNGKLVSWSILHGGSGPKCLSIEAYCVVQGKLIDQTQVIEVVSDAKLKDILKSIKAANEENFLEVINKHDDEIADYGYSKKIYTSKFGDKEKILESLLNQSFLFSVYADMQQFRAGMNMIGGLGDTVFENYNVFQAVLSNNIDKLTSALLQKHYTVCFSEAGSNRKEKELETIYSFDVFQKDLEEGEMEDLHLSDLLVFMTGADSIPPLGFDSKITVEFYDVIDGERRLPWSSTCSLGLYLPRGISDPHKFRSMLYQSLIEGQGFGKMLKCRNRVRIE